MVVFLLQSPFSKTPLFLLFPKSVQFHSRFVCLPFITACPTFSLRCKITARMSKNSCSANSYELPIASTECRPSLEPVRCSCEGLGESNREAGGRHVAGIRMQISAKSWNGEGG
jgi:hypothetical protein